MQEASRFSRNEQNKEANALHSDYRLLIDRDGPGRFERLCTLLAQVAQAGSLRRATEALGLSYRYAWGLIRSAEGRIGSPLLITKVGGASGGGAELTDTARDLLYRHQLLQKEVAAIFGPERESEGNPATVDPDTNPANRPLLMASTIGPVESGLVDALVGEYRKATKVWMRYIAAGTGQALAVARTGRVDLVLVHAPELEEQFVQEGYGTQRYPLAANAFLICGPMADPAEVSQAKSAQEAMQRIARAGAPFISRGDQSGTHVKEQQLWAAAGVNPAAPWYRVWPLGGQGSAATLRHAAAEGAYTLIDSATFATVRPEEYVALYHGDPLLRNVFTLIPVHPGRFPTVNLAGADRFIAWATSPAGRKVIASFGVREHGIPLFALPDEGR